MIDWCQLTEAELVQRQERLAHKYRNPLYWLDRLLRAVLGIPAYLVSLVFRTPYERVNESHLGSFLRLLSAAGSVAGIYFGGANARWW